LQAAEKAAADASTKRPADEAAASLNANVVLMLHRRLKMIHQRAAEANKAALEAEKERDELHNQIEQIEEHLQANPTVRGIQQLWKNSIQTIRDRHYSVPGGCHEWDGNLFFLEKEREEGKRKERQGETEPTRNGRHYACTN
jgi:phosphoenolpyruvate synthase/pyruvate phosphate dikinase